MPGTPPNPERDAAVAELDEMVGEFLLESHEGLDRMDQDLLVLALEMPPATEDQIAWKLVEEISALRAALLQGIFEEHKGRIWAENRDGGGARFCFALPAAA